MWFMDQQSNVSLVQQSALVLPATTMDPQVSLFHVQHVQQEFLKQMVNLVSLLLLTVLLSSPLIKLNVKLAIPITLSIQQQSNVLPVQESLTVQLVCTMFHQEYYLIVQVALQESSHQLTSKPVLLEQLIVQLLSL